MKSTASLRQLKFPREFRISELAWPKELERSLRKWSERPRPIGDAGIPDPGTGFKKFMADVGTGLWRLRQKMVDPETGKPREEMRRAFRHFESVWDAVHGEGIEIQDHTGNPFDSGQALVPVAFQETPGIRREIVLETIKPTIYYQKKAIQVGEVIVGKPLSNQNPAPPASP
jgi:hypothetical protein